MSNKKNMKYKNILIGLSILLLTICPASAANTVDQTLTLTIPEIISMSVDPPVVQFTIPSTHSFIQEHATSTVLNEGNVYIDIFFQIKSNFVDGNNSLDLDQIPYHIDTSNKGGAIGWDRVFYGQNVLLKEWLQPDLAFRANHYMEIPKTTAAGKYSATATYTAIKSVENQ